MPRSARGPTMRAASMARAPLPEDRAEAGPPPTPYLAERESAALPTPGDLAEAQPLPGVLAEAGPRAAPLPAKDLEEAGPPGVRAERG
mmetsp:Transcript_24551/g.76386  ORF Transcript_24551/g.76386 Transcript_24551/m.76386 type:complete len:88 (+) Transcript_24551:5-268(+)